METWLKSLLREKHLQNHDLFLVEYEKAARQLDQQPVGPSRAQFHRWLNGDLKKLPHPHHCRVLELMHPQWTAQELFSPAGEGLPQAVVGTQSKNGVDASTSSVQLLERHAALAGTIVDLATAISIDIEPDGSAEVRYSYHLLNLTDQPVSRIPRGLWFKHVDERIRIEPVQHDDRQVIVDVIHETPNHTRFAYQFFPPVPPGEQGHYGCIATGGRFVDDFYWRHAVQKDTELVTIEVVHRGRQLHGCRAVEEGIDGSEALISDQLQWRHNDDGISLKLEARDLKRSQSVTVVWEVDQ